MGQPSDPGSDPAERWEIAICPEHGQTIPVRAWNEPNDAPPHCAVDECERLVEMVEVVPAGGLVAELEAERARRERAEAALRPFAEAYAAVNYTFCPAFNGPESLAAFDEAVAIMNGVPAERSAVPTATVSEAMVEQAAKTLYEMDEKEGRGEPGGGTMLPFERLRPDYELRAKAG